MTKYTPSKEHFDDSDDETLPECGRDNKDGSHYGGGPRNIHCSACKEAGFPTEYGHGHRKGQWKFCPVLQQCGIAKAVEKELDPMLKSIADDKIPVEKYSAKSKTDTPLHDVLVELQGVDTDDIMLRLSEGMITAQQAKMALLKSMRNAESTDKEYIKECMSAVDTLAPIAPKAKASVGLPSVLANAGKLVKLWSAVSLHVKSDMHTSGKHEHQQTPKMNVFTGELTVDVKEDEYASTVPIFYMTLEHWRHLVRVRDYLSEAECHALNVWTSKQLAYGRTIMVVERAMKKMFEILDSDMGIYLTDVLDSKAQGIIQHQLDIVGRSLDSGKDIFRTTAAEKEKERRERQRTTDKDKYLAPLPLKEPNDVSCWYFTNGLNCPAKQMVNGKCKYADKHNVCGMPKAGGGFCMEKHKATEH